MIKSTTETTEELSASGFTHPDLEQMDINQLLEHYVAETRQRGEFEPRWMIEPNSLS